MKIRINRKKVSIFLALILFTLINLYYFTLSEFEDSSFESIPIQVTEPDCSKLFKSEVNETLLEYAKSWNFPQKESLTDYQMYEKIRGNCSNFLSKQKYFVKRTNKIEENFRIAYSIVIFKSASQFERLLRNIYRPWNYYCVHIDKKSSKEFFIAIEELINCLNSKYNNIINTANRVRVEWGEMSVLQADLNCMKELYNNYKDWNYLINLTGQEFPLKTNAELVKILKAYKGANNLEGTFNKRNEKRVPTNKMPFPLIWFKGSVHIAVNRNFISFIFKSSKSKLILDALSDQFVPEETFFSTLNFNSQLRIPGSYMGNPDEIIMNKSNIDYFMTRYKNWGQYPCESGKYIRQICIWGVGDLPKLVTVPNLFANKFYEDFQPATLRCLERWNYNKISKEIRTGQVAVNDRYYGSLPFVKLRFILPLLTELIP